MPDASQKPSRSQRILAYRWLYVCALAVFTLDQISKAWIERIMPVLGTYGPPHHIEVIPGFFNLVHVGNTGAAWSILTGRSTLLALLAVAALVAIFLLRRTIGLRRISTQIAFGLLCGGIIGNLVDRIARDHVVDFFDFNLPLYGRIVHTLFDWPLDSHYPAFNIADAGICVGVIMYVLITFFTREPTRAS